VARFRFRPQAALDLRRREHDAAQRELARAVAERQRRAALADAAAREVARARADSGSTSDLAHLEWYRFWIVRLEQELAALHDELRAQDAIVGDRRQACLDARRRQEALERLRDRALAAHLAAEAEHERKTIDDTATQRFTRRGLTEGV
jgi:flagellar export protein FliJ